MRAAFMSLLAAAAAFLPASSALASAGDPLPRFEDAVCPGVSGLQVEAAELLVGRIRQNAQAIGRTLAPPDTCTPNLILSFVADGHAAMGALHRDHGYAFADMSPPERAELLDDKGPVHVFSQILTRNRDGLPVSRRDSLTAPPHTTMWMAHSMIYRAVQQDIVYALVLLDAGAVRGMTLDQLADYATMRAFIHHPPAPAAIRGNSILTLFEAPAAARPPAMSAYDYALLASLYEGLPTINGTARAATISNAIGDEIRKK